MGSALLIRGIQLVEPPGRKPPGKSVHRGSQRDRQPFESMESRRLRSCRFRHQVRWRRSRLAPRLTLEVDHCRTAVIRVQLDPAAKLGEDRLPAPSRRCGRSGRGLAPASAGYRRTPDEIETASRGRRPREPAPGAEALSPKHVPRACAPKPCCPEAQCAEALCGEVLEHMARRPVPTTFHEQRAGDETRSGSGAFGFSAELDRLWERGRGDRGLHHHPDDAAHVAESRCSRRCEAALNCEVRIIAAATRFSKRRHLIHASTITGVHQREPAEVPCGHGPHMAKAQTP